MTIDKIHSHDDKHSDDSQASCQKDDKGKCKDKHHGRKKHGKCHCNRDKHSVTKTLLLAAGASVVSTIVSICIKKLFRQ
ncbi:MAG: hypothetical protein FWC40_06815 [Proteobacteria bacterium]|nr:hypothetical protein [Pseudomonadota bacterium]